MIVLMENADLETKPDNALRTDTSLEFHCPGGGKGSCLTSCQTTVASVTNPFMVTAAFTIFFGLEPLFI
jgi:hypothetical protein